MKLKDQVLKRPVGDIIHIAPSAMTLVRYHARNIRDIKSWTDRTTGKRVVFLGEFVAGGKSRPKR